MRSKTITLVSFLFVCFATHATEPNSQSKEIVAYTQQWQQCGHHLVRKGLIFKIVDVDWFTDNCQDNQNILTASPVLLRFRYFRTIKRDFFISSATEYFLRNLKIENQSAIEGAVNEFNKAYQDVQDGDIYDLVIIHENSLKLFKNSELLENTNNAFILNNYLRIWFGSDPVLPALKQAFDEK